MGNRFSQCMPGQVTSSFQESTASGQGIGGPVGHSHQNQATGAPGNAAGLERAAGASQLPLLGFQKAVTVPCLLSWGLQQENSLSHIGRESQALSR